MPQDDWNQQISLGISPSLVVPREHRQVGQGGALNPQPRWKKLRWGSIASNWVVAVVSSLRSDDLLINALMIIGPNSTSHH